MPEPTETEKLDLTDFEDLKPIFNSEDEDCVVKIAYSHKFRIVFGYLRALVQNDEMSERAFRMTTEGLRLNPANYTVWHYRRLLLKRLNKDLAPELTLTAELIDEHPKNYQTWHHRKVVIEWLNDAKQEPDFTARVLQEDSKNYHAWQHRFFVMETFNLWARDDNPSAELDFTTAMIQEDIRNNSAWNHRYSTIQATWGFTDKVVENELSFFLEAVKKAPHNESAWNYLNGLLMNVSGGYMSSSVWPQVESLYEAALPANRSPFLLLFLVDGIVERVEADKQDIDKLLPRAVKLLKELNEVDPIRRNYWAHRLRAVETLKPTVVT